MSGEVTEEQAICHAQHLDLIYSHAGMLYNIIPHALQSLNENLRLAPRPHVDDVVGSISSSNATQLVGQLGHLVVYNNLTEATPTTTTTTSTTQSSEVNSVQTTKTSQPPGNKKKNNNNHHKKITSTQSN